MFGIINIYSKSGNEIGQKLSNLYPHTFLSEGLNSAASKPSSSALSFPIQRSK